MAISPRPAPSTTGSAMILLVRFLRSMDFSLGQNIIDAVITRRSAEELKLKKGDTVVAVIKATEVMVLKEN